MTVPDAPSNASPVAGISAVPPVPWYPGWPRRWLSLLFARTSQLVTISGSDPGSGLVDRWREHWGRYGELVLTEVAAALTPHLTAAAGEPGSNPPGEHTTP